MGRVNRTGTRRTSGGAGAYASDRQVRLDEKNRGCVQQAHAQAKSRDRRRDHVNVAGGRYCNEKDAEASPRIDTSGVVPPPKAPAATTPTKNIQVPCGTPGAVRGLRAVERPGLPSRHVRGLQLADEARIPDLREGLGLAQRRDRRLRPVEKVLRDTELYLPCRHGRENDLTGGGIVDRRRRERALQHGRVAACVVRGEDSVGVGRSRGLRETSVVELLEQTAQRGPVAVEGRLDDLAWPL